MNRELIDSLPRTMRAAILVEQKKPLVVDDVELPERLLTGQVLVKVLYSGICGSQIGEIDGVKGPDPHLPHLLGHEGWGEVLATGAGVRTVEPGNRVVMHWMKGTGLEAEPPVYRWRGRRVNAGWITTFNEYAVASENRLTAVAAPIPGRVGALFGCAVTTGFGVVRNKARVTMGESVVVFGAGGVGLNVIQGSELSGASPIVAVDIDKDTLELARRFGATHTLLNEGKDLRQPILDIVGEGGADAAVENTGLPDLIETAYEVTGPRGRTILVGVPAAGKKVSLHTLPLHFGKVLTGTRGGETDPDIDIPRYVKLYTSGQIRLDEMITAEATLDTINDAIDRMRHGRTVGKCVITMGDPDGAAAESAGKRRR